MCVNGSVCEFYVTSTRNVVSASDSHRIIKMKYTICSVVEKKNSKQKTQDRNQYNNRGEIESLLLREEKKIH
jgi:hypothetical protein